MNEPFLTVTRRRSSLFDREVERLQWLSLLLFIATRLFGRPLHQPLDPIVFSVLLWYNFKRFIGMNQLDCQVRIMRFAAVCSLRIL